MTLIDANGTTKFTEVMPDMMYMHGSLSGNPEAEALAALLGVDEAIIVDGEALWLLPDDRILSMLDIEALMGGDSE